MDWSAMPLVKKVDHWLGIVQQLPRRQKELNKDEIQLQLPIKDKTQVKRKANLLD